MLITDDHNVLWSPVRTTEEVRRFPDKKLPRLIEVAFYSDRAIRHPGSVGDYF